ncbi:MAG: hypothetical protein D6B25_10540 [Desulfobulbaceae bacterium]|nr:MAG: hypothetical protein D6B25_10540 [Desulfobulbaceae bacterium]
MKKILLMLVVAGAAGFGVLNYHFILFDGSFKILKKAELNYQNTFVDARGAKKLELLMKPDLMAAGIQDVIKKTESAIQQ